MSQKKQEQLDSEFELKRKEHKRMAQYKLIISMYEKKENECIL